MKNNLTLITLLSILSILVVVSSLTKTIHAQEHQTEISESQNVEVNVDVGGGNGTTILTTFTPSQIEINAGESVIWKNPTSVAEPHTVTFIAGGDFFAPPVAPVNVPNSTKFTVVPSDANVEPKISYSNQNNIANETKTVMIDNARSTYPVIIDSTAKNVTYLNPNSIYTMRGDEKYVNSGWMWPEGMAPPGYPKITTFTVLFEKSGTYWYICLVHPWMAGSVIVN